jgi:hypothetical protein
VTTSGPLAPEVSFDRQRPAQYVFSKHVEEKLADIRRRRSAHQSAAAD